MTTDKTISRTLYQALSVFLPALFSNHIEAAIFKGAQATVFHDFPIRSGLRGRQRREKLFQRTFSWYVDPWQRKDV
jgi:hypothetical protein